MSKPDTSNRDTLRINESRLLDDLESLARIGATADGGVSRPAMSRVDVEGRAWFKQRVQDAGLDFRQDGAGNLSAVLTSAVPTSQTLLFGSHLDSVPNGGRFDGALGVLSALEALRTIREAELNSPVHLEAISFSDEEGAVLGLLGSQATSGQLTRDHLKHPRGGHDQLVEGMQRIGITQNSVFEARRSSESLLAFFELHIEQGTRLEETGVDIGVVNAIVGIRSYHLRFGGQAAHAGTMPMHKRADAFWGASAFVQRARELVMSRFSPGVMNCGQIHIEPGAFNIVPAEARLALEFRHSGEAQLNEMQSALLQLAGDVAAEHQLELETEAAGGCIAAPLDENVVAAIESATSALGLSHKRLLSFAGHDTQSISSIAPSAMLFVPSVDGISHNPKELTRPKDIINGANVVLHTVLELIRNLA